MAMRSVGELIVGDDVNAGELIIALGENGSFPGITNHYDALSKELDLGEGEVDEEFGSLLQSVRQEIRDGTITSPDLPTTVLLHEWMVKTKNGGEAPRLEEFLKALEAVGLVSVREALSKEFALERMLAGTSSGPVGDSGPAAGCKRKLEEESGSGSAPEQTVDIFPAMNPATSTAGVDEKKVNARAGNGELFHGNKRCEKESEVVFGGEDGTLERLVEALRVAGLLKEALREKYLELAVKLGVDISTGGEVEEAMRKRRKISVELPNAVKVLFTKWAQGREDAGGKPTLDELITAMEAIEGLEGAADVLKKERADIKRRRAGAEAAAITARVDETVINFNMEAALRSAIEEKQSREELSRLIELGADYKTTDGCGGSLLFDAAMWGNVEALEFLIEKGLDVNEMDSCMKTPLHWVAVGRDKSRVYECVQVLLKHGADKTLNDVVGYTPYEIALAKEFPNKEETLKLLHHYH